MTGNGIAAVVNTSPISNVSDTARLVAVYRGLESARADALFHDPYADLMAGERGRAMAALAPREARSGWPLITRTKLIDDLLQSSIADGCDCVLNLGAGFDTRPYRLELPRSLRWVEADLPGLVDEKERLLADAQPRCQLSRIKVDLADTRARAGVLRDAVGSSRHVMVVTEGLLIYLDEMEVRALAADLFAHAGIRGWILDLVAPWLLKKMRKSVGRHFANAPFKFAPPNGVAYFEAFGWRVTKMRSLVHAAGQFRRLPLLLRIFALFPEPDPRKRGESRWNGVVQLERPEP